MSCLINENHFIHQRMARKLAEDILFASHLGKTAQKGREIAYRLKAEKLSIALLKFGQFFKVLAAERHPQFGVLLSVRMKATRQRIHIPLPNLSAAAQAHIHDTVVELLRERIYLRAAA